MRNNLDATSLILQLYSVVLLLQDYNNRDLMQELQLQDEKYLKTIIKQNEEILQILKRREWLINARKIRKENRRKYK